MSFFPIEIHELADFHLTRNFFRRDNILSHDTKAIGLRKGVKTELSKYLVKFNISRENFAFTAQAIVDPKNTMI